MSIKKITPDGPKPQAKQSPQVNAQQKAAQQKQSVLRNDTEQSIMTQKTMEVTRHFDIGDVKGKDDTLILKALIDSGENPGLTSPDELEPKDTPTGVLESTKDKNEEALKEQLDDDELEIYNKFEEMIENLPEDANVNDAIFDFMRDMDPEQINTFLTAFDYVKQDEGGVTELLFGMFEEFAGDYNNYSEIISKLGDALSDEDKENILNAAKEMFGDSVTDAGYEAFRAFLYGDSESSRIVLGDQPIRIPHLIISSDAPHGHTEPVYPEGFEPFVNTVDNDFDS